MHKTLVFCSLVFLFFLPTQVTLCNSFLSVDSTLTCNGSLGDNIFADGDFGRGIANVFASNPLIAPGYTYTTAVPPPDGSYTLTNNTAAWGGLYPTWLGIRDNSSDPNGYFMVVNASFEPGLFYDQIVDGLCANTQYEFSCDIINLIQRNVTGHIRPNVDMLLDNQVVLSTGEIAQNEEWNHYSISFCTGPAQTSLRLSIRNNAPGGIGNDLALDNISFRACGPEARVTPPDVSYVCLDNQRDPVIVQTNIANSAFQAIKWQWSQDMGQTWLDLPNGDQHRYTIQPNFGSGTYLYRYLLATDNDNLQNPNCRLISEFKTLIAVPIEYQQLDTICQGSFIQVGNSQYTQSGTYVDSLISSIGCDSIVTTELTVLPNPSSEPQYILTDPSCPGFQDASLISIKVPNSTPPLSFSLQGVGSNSNGFFEGLSAGNYLLEVEDKIGCTYVANVEIEDPPPISLVVPNDTSLDFGEFLAVTTFSNYSNISYAWSPSLGLSCANCPNPVAAPASKTTYTLEVTTSDGCTQQDSFQIDIQKANFLVHAPTAFTPNDDGVNDVFQVYAKNPAGIRQIRSFDVFDRWGKQLFGLTGPVSGQQILSWDGTSKGTAVMQGVYAFVIRLELIDDRVLTYSGQITLLR